ncbi:MAG: glycine cleavage system protein GcvH [Anaerolineae bacterium]
MSSGKEITYPSNFKYAESHEWVKMDGDYAVVGISDYAQDALGDIVFVELPPVGMKLEKGKSFGVVESVKAASDVFAPISGAVEAINEKLTESPDLVNRDPFGEGWMIKLRPENPGDLDGLFDADTYKNKIETGEIH